MLVAWRPPSFQLRRAVGEQVAVPGKYARQRPLEHPFRKTVINHAHDRQPGRHLTALEQALDTGIDAEHDLEPAQRAQCPWRRLADDCVGDLTRRGVRLCENRVRGQRLPQQRRPLVGVGPKQYHEFVHAIQPVY